MVDKLYTGKESVLQTLTTHLNEIKEEDHSDIERKSYNYGALDALDFAIDTVEGELKESAVPALPKEVAMWIDSLKKEGATLYSVYLLIASGRLDNPIQNWVSKFKDLGEVTETIARAWLDGYMVLSDSWVVRVLDGYYEGEYIKVFNLYGNRGHYDTTKSVSEALKFDSELKAKGVALIINGEHQEVDKI